MLNKTNGQTVYIGTFSSSFSYLSVRMKFNKDYTYIPNIPSGTSMMIFVPLESC